MTPNKQCRRSWRCPREAFYTRFDVDTDVPGDIPNQLRRLLARRLDRRLRRIYPTDSLPICTKIDLADVADMIGRKFGVPFWHEERLA